MNQSIDVLDDRLTPDVLAGIEPVGAEAAAVEPGAVEPDGIVPGGIEPNGFEIAEVERLPVGAN